MAGLTVGGIAGTAAGAAAAGGKGAPAGAGAGVRISGGVGVGANLLAPPGDAGTFWTGGPAACAGTGAGAGGTGTAGSADARPPANTMTPMNPAAVPAANTRHQRAPFPGPSPAPISAL